MGRALAMATTLLLAVGCGEGTADSAESDGPGLGLDEALDDAPDFDAKADSQQVPFQRFTAYILTASSGTLRDRASNRLGGATAFDLPLPAGQVNLYTARGQSYSIADVASWCGAVGLNTIEPVVLEHSTLLFASPAS